MTALSGDKKVILEAFQKHVGAELRKDLDETLATMNCVSDYPDGLVETSQRQA